MMSRIAAVLPLSLLLWACGGAQSPEPTEAPAEEPVVEEVVEVEETVEEAVDERIWYVYWDGIHCLSIYPQPGQVRGEEAPRNAIPAFNNAPNDYFSIVSAYYEREDDFAPVIEAATSLEDLLERLSAIDMVEVEEDINPIYGAPQGW